MHAWVCPYVSVCMHAWVCPYVSVCVCLRAQCDYVDLQSCVGWLPWGQCPFGSPKTRVQLKQVACVITHNFLPPHSSSHLRNHWCCCQCKGPEQSYYEPTAHELGDCGCSTASLALYAGISKEQVLGGSSKNEVCEAVTACVMEEY